VKVQGLTLVGTNEHFLVANSYTLGYGRNLTDEDVDLARRVTVVGTSIQKKLFANETPVGKTIKVNEQPYMIIGVLAEKGSSFGQSQDDLVLVPITRYLGDFGRTNRTVNIAIQSTSQAAYNQTLDKAIGAMRAARKLKLGQDNDFEIYSNDTLVTAFAQIADVIRTGAFVISAIAMMAPRQIAGICRPQRGSVCRSATPIDPGPSASAAGQQAAPIHRLRSGHAGKAQ
jgi:putative ABC transport system permease protein